MLDAQVVDKLRERYKNIHPLIFHRSLERAKSPGDLFDILHTFPDKYPIIWDEIGHCWQHTDDLFQSDNYGKK